MMYVIIDKVSIPWHVGEPFPFIPPKTRVINFQADGHELDLIINAMKLTRGG